MKIGDRVKVKKVGTVSKTFHNRIGKITYMKEDSLWSIEVYLPDFQDSFAFREGELELVLSA